MVQTKLQTAAEKAAEKEAQEKAVQGAGPTPRECEVEDMTDMDALKEEQRKLAAENSKPWEGFAKMNATLEEI
ncbi:unnamed protein product [Linum trigynum]|uniref:Uncharacterized protein n=1 Tax=Linum trigynum TaxID=586398 RepID=A0AAV2DCX8_9ROSI